MDLSKKAKFWIIVDLCRKPEYYKDLHALLALPSAYIIRYDYRKSQVEAGAIEALGKRNFPRDILLLYGQYPGMIRGEEFRHDPKKLDDICWIATRFGEMKAVVDLGEAFAFDIAVSGYPKNNTYEVRKLMKPKLDPDNPDFAPLVSLSDDIEAFSCLRDGNNEGNWIGTVNHFQGSTQFSGDTFWRLSSPLSSKKILPVKENRFYRPGGGAKILRGVRSYYKVRESDKVTFEIVSHEPSRDDASGTRVPREVSVEASADSKLVLGSKANQDLRTYTGLFFDYVVKRFNSFGSMGDLINFSTSPKSDEYVSGPELSISIKVEKNLWFLILGMGYLIVGSICVFLATKDNISNTETVIRIMKGIVSLAVAYYYLFGKFPERPFM